MKIGFAGAGGVGSYFGGKLARGGADITLIGRGEHAAALKSNGLILHENGSKSRVELDVIDTSSSDDLTKVASLDWLIFTCKSHQNATLADRLIKELRPQAHVASLQNGIDNPKHLNSIFRRKIVGGISIRFAAHVVSPGVVHASGDGYAIFGEFPRGSSIRIQKLVEICRDAGVDVRETKNIVVELWRKLIINNAVNPLTALLQRDTGYVFQNKSCRDLVKSLMKEAAQAALADGVALNEEDVKQLYAIVSGLEPFKPSMLVDVEMERTPEVDAICGPVIERAEELGEPAVVTKTVSSLLLARFPKLFANERPRRRYQSK